MAPRSIAVYVAALCTVAVPSIHADGNQAVAIAIRLHVDLSITSKRITGGLKDETEAIWRPYGIRLDWTDADASERSAGIMSLDASLERRFGGRQPLQWPTVLGRAVMKPDTLAWRPIRVSFDATESVLAHRTTIGRSSVARIVTDRELARALGRVLAHEIGHVLIDARYHDRAGLMRANFSPEELAEPDAKPFRLTCSSADRLGSRLRALNGYTQVIAQEDSETLNLKGLGGTRRDFSGGRASCIAP
jgi:hypothetical protein